MQETGPYILISRLGEGGMAEVFKAVKRGPDGFEKPIALKRILPHLADNRSFIKMLSAEARLAAVLDHPNLVHVFDFFAHEDTFFIALEYVSGHNLRKIMNDAKTARSPVPWPAAVHVIAETLKGLDFAHKRRGPEGPLNIVHRDVTPQNILVSFDGLVKLSDFGIARANIAREETESGVLKGKQRYLSPEQLKSQAVDFRADLFSTGVVLYELLTGTHPFEEESDFEAMKRIAEGKYRPLFEARPELPSPLHRTVALAMSADPGRRPADAAEFRSALLAGQEKSWLARGTEELAAWIEALYPKGSGRSDPPIEKTPLLSLTGTPLPFRIEPTQSMISGVAEISHSRALRKRRMRRRALFWGAVSAPLIAFALVLLRSALRQPPETAPEPAPAAPAAAIPADPLPITPLAELPTATPAVPVTVEEIERLARPDRRAAPPEARPLEPGQLALQGPPGADVYLNGRLIGRLPMQTLKLNPGVYSVLIAPAQKPRTMARVTIRPGKHTSLSWKAPAAPAKK